MMFSLPLLTSILLLLEICQKAFTVGIFASQYALEDQHRERLVKKMNQLRREISASDMTEIRWDSQLESFALEKAKKCSFQQPASYLQSAGHDTVGLNMFATSEVTDIQNPIEAALQEWWSKGQFYVYGPYQSGKCLNKEACANYVQLITAKTFAMGCASVNCSLVEGAGPVTTGALPICAFSPDIVKGEYPYAMGEKCASCPERCTNELCSHDSAAPAEFKSPVEPPRITARCADLYPLCSYWAQAGQCSKNPSYMKGNCSAACSHCEPKKIILNCEDSGSECSEWSSMGLCVSNPHFMIWQCPKICGFCNSSGPNAYPPLIRA